MKEIMIPKHVAIGILLLLVVTLVLGWFLGRYVPGVPRELRPEILESYPMGRATYVPVSEIVEVSRGSVMQIEDLTQGEKFFTNRPMVCYSYDTQKNERSVEVLEWGSLIDRASEKYVVKFPSFEARVDDARVLTLEAFSEWYPDFIERGGARGEGLTPSESKIVLVDLTVSNFSDQQSFNLDGFQLASDAFRQIAPGCLGNGYSITYGVLESLNRLPHVDAGESRDYASLLAIKPGETRSLTLPFHLSRNAFSNDGNFNSLDLTHFDLEIDDYERGKVYRFALL